MKSRQVQVYVTLTREGRPRVSTMALEEDLKLVDAALKAVGTSDGPVKSPSDWPDKRRKLYVEELKKRGLEVTYIDNTHLNKNKLVGGKKTTSEMDE